LLKSERNSSGLEKEKKEEEQNKQRGDNEKRVHRSETE
jgi:hypothetical protein